MGEFDEIIGEFLAESHEGLEQIASDLLILEKAPGDKDVLDRIFRAVHTIKGTCGFLEFKKLESLTHAGENLLNKMRDGSIVANETITNALLSLSDAAREFLEEIAASGSEGDGDYSALTVRLEQLASGDLQQKPEGAAAPASPPTAPPATAPAVTEGTTPQATKKSSPPPKKSKPAPKKAGGTKDGAISERTIRVDVRVLDKVMNLVGELVLVRNRLLQFDVFHKDRNLAGTLAQLNLITSELQESVTRTRMRPIGTMWRSYGRLVRDLSSAVGKKARIEMEGAETELDRNILQAIKDPITHLIRNAVDHGVEPAAVREASGKNPVALVRLRAFHEGGQVNIDISDDGAGLNLDRVREKALNNGIVTPDDLKEMDDSQVANLIFTPGFSTAASVTSISGRGVGMDVVKTNVEELGGSVELITQEGVGTTTRLKMPLTLAIIPALFVETKDTLFAVPQSSVVELVRPRGEGQKESVEFIHGTPVSRLRGQILPLVFLCRELGLDTRKPEVLLGTGSDFTIVVFRAEGQQFGLVVDHILNTREIVVKSLDNLLKSLGVYAGATIRGDGEVSLILDVVHLANRSGVIAGAGSSLIGKSTGKKPLQEHREMDEILVVKGPAGSQMGIPVTGIERLEEFRLKQVEQAGGRQVVQYRGDVLPLVPLEHLLPERRKEEREPRTEDEKLLSDMERSRQTLQVVVCEFGSHEVGLVMERVLDIVSVDKATMGSATRDGTLGTAVIGERITEILDIDNLLFVAGEKGLVLPETSAQA